MVRKEVKLPYVSRVIKKPSKWYKCLEDFRLHGAASFREQKFTENPDKWPCLECNGKAWIYDPNDVPCPIEGYKMVARIKCPVCKGTGFGPKAPVVEEYRRLAANYRRDLAEFNSDIKLYKTVVQKLDESEIKVLKKFWNGY